jgi:hypothetical protein
MTSLLCIVRALLGVWCRVEGRVGFVVVGWVKAAATATGRPAEERRVVTRRKAEENRMAILLRKTLSAVYWW